MRVPWIEGASAGKRTKALAELVDVYQTVCDVMGVDLPEDTVPFDGVSLRPVLEAPETATVKDVALSTFPRCAHKGMPVYGARGMPGGADNTCLEVERTDFTWMGYAPHPVGPAILLMWRHLHGCLHIILCTQFC